MKYSISLGFLLLASCSIPASVSVSASVPFPFSTLGWEFPAEKIIGDRYLSIAGIVVGTSTLEEAVDLYGPSDSYRGGPENYSPSLVCYTSPNKDLLVVFQSGPLGGWDIITAVWIGKSGYIDDSRCTKSALVREESMTIGDLSLGLTKVELRTAFGTPTFSAPPFYAYRYLDEVESGEKKLSVSSGLEFEFEQNSLSWFRVYKQFSY